ncbi:MAG TPA: Rieske 2Fe-2S domain-containing protein [Stellaceae bacterium]|nr:Rieske 2Fe-2S domain-containing protein [Stellaceae bacterium]
MLTAETNERLTRVGPGTRGGALLRLYWQPAALAEELAGNRPVKAVRLLGEDFVLFKDERGRYGMLDRHCAHRGADLAFGRREDGGLRCAFHGWLYDVEGKCLETPAEPEPKFCQRVRQRAYPVVERGGIVFAYLGPGAPPAFPDFDCFVAPDAYTFAFKGHVDCNWLQVLEIGIDPAHTSFLHRFFDDADPAANYGRPFRANSADSDLPITKVMRDYTRPTIETASTEYGLQICTRRAIDAAKAHIRVTHLVFPQAFVIPLSADMTISQWHVPIDDVSSYWYAIFTSFGAPVNKQEMRDTRLELYALPDYKPRRNKANDYGFDPEEQARHTFTGMGADINVHDQWAVESQGPIHDRTREFLGQSDIVIVKYRRLLLQAIEEAAGGGRPPMVLDAEAAKQLRGPMTVDGVGPAEGWEAYWRESYAKCLRDAPWAKQPNQAA